MEAAPHFVIDTNSNVAPQVAQVPAAIADRLLMGTYQRTLKAKYDAASLSPEMEQWWSSADRLSPRSSASKATRGRVRARARYEVHESGSIANGILKALMNSVIGCGPRLQVQTENKEFNKLIEDEWEKFAKEIQLKRKLRTMFAAKVVDGEAYAERIYNPRLNTPVKFDIRLSEADLWTNPLFDHLDPREDDGHRYDAIGNPIRYRRLKYHPGDDHVGLQNPLDFDDIDSQYVVHWYDVTRPGQRRGMSEFAMSLKDLAELRRYRMSVQAAAETAANHAAVMFSTVSAFAENPAMLAEDDILATIPLAKNSALTLPEGWDIKQLRAEQPTTNYTEFVEERISAASRPFQMPLNVATGSSRNHNFASAKLDWMQFRRANEPRRADCEDSVLSTIVGWFLFEATRLPDYLPPFDPTTLKYTWQWPVDDPIDVTAQAKADQTYWNMGLLTDERFCKREGLDIDELREQQVRQYESRDDVGENVPQPGVQMTHAIMDSDAQPTRTQTQAAHAGEHGRSAWQDGVNE